MTDNQRAAWMEKAAEQIIRCRAQLEPMKTTRAKVLDIISAAYGSRETKPTRQLCGPGGCAYGLCEKHGVPLISTITEQTYCAVCESWRAQQLEQQLAAANARCAAMRDAITSVATTLHAQAEEVHKAEHIALAIHLHNLGDDLQAAADSSGPSVEQIAKDHRAMEAARRIRHMTVRQVNGDWQAVSYRYGLTVNGVVDPADAVLALARQVDEFESARTD